ncbi:glycoside hydrolase family 16 protein [Taibaiella chishuiensis]|uniref:Glycosyl hydrolase family 16 n=1 Tax=Taibaiella chishuiensis TaxID=1434707 RepID=A0A2P8CWF8_9BACT|nr:glycoside hydrolase family 16 protein [Taibaiella chishuiensis]PSK89295.1 glycosyl hydrolase family 16 [Taibaiella chishuiensis]
MRRSLLLLACSGMMSALHAQSGWLPPQQFPAGTNLCDTASWQLVFTDDFDGDQIDRSKWITFGSYPGMAGGDHEHWNGARTWYDNPYILRDKNVVVSEGTCKLVIRRETGNWSCTDCPNPVAFKKQVSAAQIATYRNLPDGTDNAYNNGRFEARLRFPVFKGAWCALWTWHGLGVNEIDIAEAWGGGLSGGNQRRNTFSTHAWGPDPSANPPLPNPYNLPYDAAWSNKFPGQGWWRNLPGGNAHRQDDWHTYTCEWDDNELRFYLDGNLAGRRWKYIRDQGYVYNGHNYKLTVGAECQPQPGANYYISYGYPYNTKSASQLILLARVNEQAGLNREDRQAGLDSVLHPGVLGQMEVDYVKIWQRHPEQDNHRKIGMNLLKTAPAADYNTLPGQHGQTLPYTIHIVSTRDNRDRQQFQLFEGSGEYRYPTTPLNFEWDITVTTAGREQHYKRQGAFVATPWLQLAPGAAYSMSWSLHVSRNGATVARYSGCSDSHSPAYEMQNKEVHYFNALFTDVPAYEQSVAAGVKQATVSEIEIKDTAYLDQLIEQIRTEALAPYLQLQPEDLWVTGHP